MKEQGLYSPHNEKDNCGIGFVAHIKGQRSHEIVDRGLETLVHLEHRGATGADNKTGDGAGVLTQMPDKFFRSQISELPQEGLYGAGNVFLPRDEKQRSFCKQQLESVVQQEGLSVISWRQVPVDSSQIGDIAKKAEPVVEQIFIDGSSLKDQEKIAIKLYVIRKIIEHQISAADISQKQDFYICSLSNTVIVYKGMLMSCQVQPYYLDLQQGDYESAIALVHSRFSTNTFPSWDLAQPFRMLAHNGEINTIKGNKFWMSARESLLESDVLGEDLKKILPIVIPDKSDSASFDNALEFLVMAGRSLPHSLMMMIPESWNDKNPIPTVLKKFYEYHATFMEPWDGPASMVFCDGRYVGGTLDRNGLRPSRYVVTKDDLIVMGSEVGAQVFAPEKIVAKGRLEPGKILLVDTKQGRIIPNQEVKDQISTQKPYSQWVDENRINIEDLQGTKESADIDPELLITMQQAAGYTLEDVEKIILPKVINAQEPTGSMGTDTPLAVLSDQPQRPYNYFKQLFAQVTNPPIDPIREDLVMTLTSFIGSQKNLLSEEPENCRFIKFTNPIFLNSDLQKIKDINNFHFKTVTLPILFEVDRPGSLDQALTSLMQQAEKKVDEGFTFLVLSDKGIDPRQAAIPSLLALGAVHHHLIRVKKRTRCGIILETSDAREVHHFALLFGYGADAVNPYLTYSTISRLVRSGQVKLDFETAQQNYIKAIHKGLKKVLSKMGISTLRSYRGAQIFEAVGLAADVVDRFFSGTDSRIGGIGLEQISREAQMFHQRAFGGQKRLPSQGMYSYRREGEKHAWNPDSIYMLQWASRTGDYQKYQKYARIVNEDNKRPHVLRGLLDFKSSKPIPKEMVEPIEKITSRFVTGAMSYGSISKEAHEAMAIAMNTVGGMSNTGEGGEDPERFKDNRRSKIKQVASGRFGVTSNYLANADEIQIKMAQGAKPGEGGQLPGHKVDKIIATRRYSTPGVTLISPPPHHDIYSIEDLAQLIFDLKNANSNARISVKLVSEVGVGTVAAGVAKAHADMILISGYDGGTGASPLSSIKHAGLPWELGLSETQQTLVLNDLRGRVRLQTDGQLKTGRDVVIAAMLGAEEFGFSTAALIVLGCVMMRKCHQNTCPVGIATQDIELRKRFRGDPQHLINYFQFVAEEVREIMADLGVKHFDDLIGRVDLLEQRKVDHWKAGTMDLSKILHRPSEIKTNASFKVIDQQHAITNILDRKILDLTSQAIEQQSPVSLEMDINNTDRTVGAMTSYQVSKKYDEQGLPDGTISIVFNGSAGQAFGAFLNKGMVFRLQGDANDYFGKGLAGGKLIAVPPQGSTFIAEQNIIIGNVALYGATGGQAFVCGLAGERFGIRNSGATAVVEGTGDHCCEYMTGGKVIVLGSVGRNFAAGMSGGTAYVLDERGDFDYFCNKAMVELEMITDSKEAAEVKMLIEQHQQLTGSSKATKILADWQQNLSKFIKIIPVEYKKALEQMEIAKLNEQLDQIGEQQALKEME